MATVMTVEGMDGLREYYIECEQRMAAGLPTPSLAFDPSPYDPGISTAIEEGGRIAIAGALVGIVASCIDFQIPNDVDQPFPAHSMRDAAAIGTAAVMSLLYQSEPMSRRLKAAFIAGGSTLASGASMDRLLNL
ncbi:MAG: hypothetical protein V1735_02465 [Nanoarchaeota archaeon]